MARALPTALRRAGLLACLLACLACGGPEAGERAGGAVDGLFVEVSAALGIDAVYDNGGQGSFLLPEIMGPGCAFIDADGDGDLEVLLAEGGPLALESARPGGKAARLRLFRNELVAGNSASLRFTDVSADAGLELAGYVMGFATGDVDNDGDTDLYVSADGPDQLFLNQGEGRFEDATTDAGLGDARWNASATFVDFDRDGWLDLFVTAYLDFWPHHAKRCKALTGEADYCRPSDFPPLPDRLYHNRGDGSFDDVSVASGIASLAGPGLGVVAADLDGDGWSDLYVANDGAPNFLWRNRGNGTFEEAALAAGVAVNQRGESEAGMGVAAADADRDGDRDLLLTHLALETNTFYRQVSPGHFRDHSAASGLGPPSWPWTGFGAAWLDFDADGLLDLLTVNGGVEMRPSLARMADPQPLHMPRQLFRNLDGQRFAVVPATTGPLAERRVSRGLASADVDDDGDLDLLVANNDGRAELWLAAGAPAGWLGLKLVGAAGGRSGQGARVEVLGGGERRLVRWAQSDGSYLSASDPRVLFHLGAAAAATPVREVVVAVDWPGGRQERFRVTTGRYTTLVEGGGGP